MRTATFLAAVLAFTGSGLASAEDCEALIMDYQQMLLAKVDLAGPNPQLNEQAQLSRRLFEQGADQCRDGQREEAELTLKQAIAALSGS